MKKGRSFSETIEGLITARVDARVDKLLEVGPRWTGREDELSDIVEGIRRRTRARTT